jgi:protein tyrosine phosphatase (PTP) superfamily phosphohydrolase (DUF442 family)
VKKLIRSLLFLIVALVVLVVVGGPLLYRGRLRPVVSGEVYRSGQPDGARIRSARRELGIRSVLNLRGESPRTRWYEGEGATEAVIESEKLGLRRGDVRFETDEAPGREEVRALLAFLDGAPRPLLIHCQTGVDRTGWAATIVQLLRGTEIDVALEELSRKKGHFCERSSCRLHGFFDQYRQWLQRNGRAHSAPTFRAWIAGYCPEPYNARVTISGIESGERLSPGAQRELRLTVKNTSASPWHSTAVDYPIRAGVRIIGPYAQPVEDPLALFRRVSTPGRDLFRAPSGPAQGPGQERHIETGFVAPSDPGIYYVQADMVEEKRHWFSDVGTPGAIVEIRVE